MNEYDDDDITDKKQLFLDSIKDAVSDLLYYDRQNDEELTEQDVEELLESKKITLKEIVDIFSKEIKVCVPGVRE